MAASAAAAVAMLRIKFAALYFCLIGAFLLSTNNYAKAYNDRNSPDMPGQAQSKGNLKPVRNSRPDGAIEAHPSELHALQGAGGAPRGPRSNRLADAPECFYDIDRLCGKGQGSLSNFAVLDCLRSDEKSDEGRVSDQCQHVLWKYKRSLSLDIKFDAAAQDVCYSSIAKIHECKEYLNMNEAEGRGMVIPCLIEHLHSPVVDLHTNIMDARCRAFLRRMEGVVFSDYRLIHKFVAACETEIERLKCGRDEKPEESDLPHNQGRTLACMSAHLGALNLPCKHELLRVAELQADDYHSDRALYYACRDAREQLCHTVQAGEGRVYRCLFQHKFEREMGDKCRDMLTQRQQLQEEDYRVNIGLATLCHTDIVRHQCLASTKRVDDIHDAHQSAILLCLEGAVKNGDKISPECAVELMDVRQSLMADYQLSPLLVRDCSTEILHSCADRASRTIHCLMDLARSANTDKGASMSSECARSLEDVLTEGDIGENLEVDPVLHEACQPVADVVCKNIPPGEGRVLSCLMASLHKPAMTATCHELLMEVYYFISRDFRLDSRLYKSCRKDATRLCHAPDQWHRDTQGKDATVPSLGHMVFACLFRHTTSLHDDRVDAACTREVQRVMRERSLTVDLDPEVEASCRKDLGQFCHKTSKNEEMECLEENLDRLIQSECRKVVEAYVVGEAEEPTLNAIFVEACAPFWEEHCQDAMRAKEEKEGGGRAERDEGNTADDLMSCLIDLKHHPDMKAKCRAGIEHHQILSLKNFKFSPLFKEACKADIAEHCKEDFEKAYVVRCLSESVQNNMLLNKEQKITKPCRKQLKFELLQMGENIKLDPELNKACLQDLKKFCRSMGFGKSAKIECLKKQKPEQLTTDCKAMVFKRELQEAKDPDTDYVLISKCKSMIKRYCVDQMHSADTIFVCLQRMKEEPDFDPTCAAAIIAREELRAHDIRLNPELEKHCLADAKTYCGKELQRRRSNQAMEGEVILCLRIQFAKKKLSSSCEKHVELVVRESAKDYKQDLPLTKACSKEISMCKEIVLSDNDEMDGGRVQKCLKDMIVDKSLTLRSNKDCFTQVSRLLEESAADVYADVELARSCVNDIQQHCADIPRGGGRHMTCLMDTYKSGKRLYDSCNKTLTERIQMWQIVAPAVALPDSLPQLFDQAYQSPARNYFAVVMLMAVAAVFVGGLVCGKLTRRVSRNVKNR